MLKASYMYIREMKIGLLVLVLVACEVVNSQKNLIVTIGAMPFDRVNMPLYAKIASPLPANQFYYLENKKRKEKIIAQKAGNNLLCFITKNLNANTSITYRIIPISYYLKIKDTELKQVMFKKNKEGFQATVKGSPVFFYHTKIVQPPVDSPSYYQRSGFIHPLYAPGGTVLTDDFPSDHAHQHALFMAWPNTTFRNAKVDFWNQHLQTGTVEHAAVMEVSSGPVFGQLKVKHRYLSLKYGTVLEEIWTITVYALSSTFLFDIESNQVNITGDTLFLHQYIYGGMAFRGTREWNKAAPGYMGDTMGLVTSEGKNRMEANHTHARYVTSFGKTRTGFCGVTVFDHPSNFRYPQAIRVHPDMPYWAYSPVVDGDFTINPGQHYVSRYRYFVFNAMEDIQRCKDIELGWKFTRTKEKE